MSDRGVTLVTNEIPASGTGAPYVVSRHFGVDKPEVMKKWLKEAKMEAGAAVGQTVAEDHARRVAMGRRGGKARWAKASRKERQAHARLMLEARISKGSTLAPSSLTVAPTPDALARILTPGQVIGMTGLSRATINAAIRAGRLKSIVVGGSESRRRYGVTVKAALDFMARPGLRPAPVPETFRIKITRLRGTTPRGAKRITIPLGKKWPNIGAVEAAIRAAVGVR